MQKLSIFRKRESAAPGGVSFPRFGQDGEPEAGRCTAGRFPDDDERRVSLAGKREQRKILHRVILLSALGHLALLATVASPPVFFTPVQADNRIFILLNPEGAAARPERSRPSPVQRREGRGGERHVPSRPSVAAVSLPVPADGVAAAGERPAGDAPALSPQRDREPPPSRAEIPSLVRSAQPTGGQTGAAAPRSGLADGSGHEAGAVGPPGGPAEPSGVRSGPRFVYREMPAYPSRARRQGQEGVVLLRLTIDPDGRLANIEVVQTSSPEFTEAAVAAVKRSTFRPALTEGRPIPSVALLPVRFALENR